MSTKWKSSCNCARTRMRCTWSWTISCKLRMIQWRNKLKHLSSRSSHCRNSKWLTKHCKKSSKNWKYGIVSWGIRSSRCKSRVSGRKWKSTTFWVIKRRYRGKLTHCRKVWRNWTRSRVSTQVFTLRQRWAIRSPPIPWAKWSFTKTVRTLRLLRAPTVSWPRAPSRLNSTSSPSS